MKHEFFYDNETFTYEPRDSKFQGAYGRIFINEGKSLAMKVFKVDENDNSENKRIHTEKVFNSECEAYELASKCPYLKDYIPYFYGKSPITSDIKDQNGDIVNDKYYVKYAYCMEFIDKQFKELGNVEYDNSKELFDGFLNLKINHYIDSSIVEKDNLIKKIVDFAMEDIEYFIE